MAPGLMSTCAREVKQRVSSTTARAGRLQTSCFPPGVHRGKTEELEKTLKSNLQEAGGAGGGLPHSSLSVASV